MTKIIELIYTEERRGVGKEGDPFRLCLQLWTKEGNLIVEYDPTSEKSFIDYTKFFNLPT